VQPLLLDALVRVHRLFLLSLANFAAPTDISGMRTILAAVVLSVFVAPAWAENFDGPTAIEAWYVAQHECRLNETSSGEAITADQAAVQCAKRDELTQSLESHDFCFVADEQEWEPC
ncbi:MAG: hypothetical protein KDJ36_09160, partial [Hyphomicrobiaceae bacterium]|nr:hypothetical protein [Hyphomicrobiaceae bacterium]